MPLSEYTMTWRNGTYEFRKRNHEVETNMIDAEGKYFRDHSGWIVGPLKPISYYNYKFSDEEGRFYDASLRSATSSSRDLIPVPLDKGEVVVTNKLSLGTCVERGGKLYWVTREDEDDWYLSNRDEGIWLCKGNDTTTIPAFNAPVPELDAKKFFGKWVWHETHGDYIKVINVHPYMSNPQEGFIFEFRGHKVGRSFYNNFSVSNFDLTKVEDEHPREKGLVRAIQGEGKYLYAKHQDGSYWLAYHSGYSEEYYLFSLTSGETQLLSFRKDDVSWYQFELFRTDELPFNLPFDSELCIQSLEVWNSGYRNSVQDWLYHNCREAYVNSILSRTKPASNTRGNIALYLNNNQIRAGKIQSLRPGRALRALLPEIKDADLEKLVDKFRKDFPTGDYTVHRGFAPEDFKRGYSGAITTMQNPATTASRKSLANSCMRHDFSHLKHHPAEAYASGEFEMLWTETPDGKIGSRMVVWHPPVGHHKHGVPQCGPVYGTCEYSMDLLQDLMKSAGADLFTSSTWVGAKLQRLQKSSSEVFLPYIDNEQGVEVHEGYLLISEEDSDDCACSANNTCGYSYVSEFGNSRCTCARCGDRVDEDDMYYTDDGYMCEDCYSNNYFTCEEYDQVYPVSEMCTVFRMQRWGVCYQSVCLDARNNHYTYCEDGEYWHNEDILILADGSCLGGDAHNEAAECMMTNEYYLLDDLIPTTEGDYVSKEYYDNHKEEFTMNEDGELEQIKEAA